MPARDTSGQDLVSKRLTFLPVRRRMTCPVFRKIQARVIVNENPPIYSNKIRSVPQNLSICHAKNEKEPAAIERNAQPVTPAQMTGG
jgi:hypothetical protein